MVATDRSQSADRAVRWAADLAAASQAELLLFQVLPEAAGAGNAAIVETGRREASETLQRFAEQLAGHRGRGRIEVATDPALAILRAVEEEAVDVAVLGNAGMRGRKQFLLGNIPNRITHGARCTVVIVNTVQPDDSDSAGGRGRRAATADPVSGLLTARAWRIGRVMARAGVRQLLRRPESDDAARESARRLRSALDELGPTFAKLGQILSTRPDLLSPALVEELSTLQERVTPLTEAEVVAAMERELGVPWEDVFASIEPAPLAAGTIAQVHRAVLESGERVVVKVQRPTAERDILQDLALLEMFAQQAAKRPELRQVFDVPAMVEHLATSLRRELDFRSEAGNLRRMREVLAPFPRLGVPDVYEQYSTARLLVMQEIQGAPAREAPAGPARQEAARQLLEAYYHQVLTAGFFHADPHPGNMKWWNDRIYFLDLGMVGEVEADARGLILLLLLAFSQHDAAFLSEVVLLLGNAEPDATTDLAAFREDLAGLITRYRDLSLRELRLGPLLQEVTRIAARHRIRVPTALTLIGKAFAQMQLIAAELEPTLDPFSVAESYVLRNTLRQLVHGASPRQLFYEAEKVRLRLVRLLEALEGSVGVRPGAGMRVQLRGIEGLEETIAGGTRRLSLAVGLSGSLMVAAIAAGSPRVPRWLPKLMGGVSTALAAGLLMDRPRRRV